MARTLGSLGVAGLILAALSQTSNGTKPRDKTVKCACVIFVHNVNHTVFEGRIRRAQFTKWFKKDYPVGHGGVKKKKKKSPPREEKRKRRPWLDLPRIYRVNYKQK